MAAIDYLNELSRPGWDAAVDELDRLRETHPKLADVSLRLGVELIDARGQYDVINGQVTIALWMLVAPEDDIRNTIRHEAAHALVAPDAHEHSARWFEAAGSLGVRPSTVEPSDVVADLTPEDLLRVPDEWREAA